VFIGIIENKKDKSTTIIRINANNRKTAENKLDQFIKYNKQESEVKKLIVYVINIEDLWVI